MLINTSNLKRDKIIRLASLIRSPEFSELREFLEERLNFYKSKEENFTRTVLEASPFDMLKLQAIMSVRKELAMILAYFDEILKTELKYRTGEVT